MERICSVPGCERKYATRGWCSMHYQRWTDHGDLNHEREKKIFVFPPCSVDECDREARCRGLCKMHYGRQLAKKPLVPKAKPTPQERFWSFVATAGPDACWLWTGCVGQFGYGQWGYTVGTVQRKSTAHRFAYEFAHGPIPEGLHIDHLCFVRLCVNPAHLEAVTQAENNRRAARRRMNGRAPKRKRKPGVMV